MIFEQPSINERCAAAAECYRRLGGQASDFFFLVPISESRLRRAETRLQATLPPGLRSLYLTSECGHFEWSIPPEATREVESIAPVTQGKLHWDLGDLWECEQLRRAWVKSDFRDRSLPRNHLWHDALPFQYLGEGEFLAVNLRSATGDAVVYLSPSLEGLHGVELAPTVGEFIDRFTRLGCPGPEQAQLAPFVTPERGLDVSGPAARLWRELLHAGST